ncbi:hypothetical protein LJR118_002144 [Acidovorax sp. LjRoot118]|uniref:hypothetical protein n=1 Tax=Acidovorax sp. LjRoot118 TaxID=3342256 RepID=UPI000FB946F0
MVVSKETIEREAAEAASKGLSLDDSCPYPFRSAAGMHFKASYFQALLQQKPQPQPSTPA